MPQSEELLDVVDDNDRVIDTRKRGEIHEKNLKHRSIHLLVFNGAGDIFLQKRSMTKDNHPGLWDSSVSGHVDAGETYDECVLRESVEEIGLTLSKPPERLFKLNASAQTGFEFTWIYRYFAEGPFSLDPVEIDEGGWFSPAELDRWLTDRPEDIADTVHLIWPEYQRSVS